MKDRYLKVASLPLNQYIDTNFLYILTHLNMLEYAGIRTPSHHSSTLFVDTLKVNFEAGTTCAEGKRWALVAATPAEVSWKGYRWISQNRLGQSIWCR